jgi:hypothetical protein
MTEEWNAIVRDEMGLAPMTKDQRAQELVEIETEYVKPQPPLVVYHSPCLDGFTAAWACWLVHPEAEFVPGVYGQEPPDCAGRDVYLLDFSYKRSVMEKIYHVANSITVLDHHKSAQAELEGFAGSDVRVVFDMEKSGARLAWEWFHPGVEVPLLVQLVEDRDLWRFALPNSKELNAAFFSYDYDFATWNHLADMEADTQMYHWQVIAGKAIERAHQKNVKELVLKLRHERDFMQCVPEVYGARCVPCANLPYTYASDAANLMAEGVPFAATYCQDADGQYVFSLRSKEDGADVSVIASRYGGGGHKHAAGFRVANLESL